MELDFYKFLPISPVSGVLPVDALVQQVIQVYEQAFPGQIVACYIEGSYADQTYLATSDIDVVIVFRGKFADDAARHTAERTWTGNQESLREVDIIVVDEDSLRAGIKPNLKLGSRHLYGEDVCSNYPILPIETWTRERMHAAYWLLNQVYQRPNPVQLPLNFPSPSDEFYGYTNRTIRLPDGKDVPCTRNLVRTTGWAATARLALQAGQYAGRKRDCARLYREHIGDEWASLLEEIVIVCRDEWQYLIPSESNERKHLREICQRTLHFEQHFLMLYKSYLLEQLRSQEQEPVRFARWVQKQLPLDDTEVIAALKTI